jgi:hypothetical protein
LVGALFQINRLQVTKNLEATFSAASQKADRISERTKQKLAQDEEE